MKKAQRSLTPQERLENLYDSLADDVFDVSLDTDEETKERATSVVRAAVKKVQDFGRGRDIQVGKKGSSRWTERRDKDGPPDKAPGK